jgi:hypothetical protein
MNYSVALGGMHFDVPSLPWRAVRDLQPALLAWADRHDFSAAGAVRLTAADLAELADLVFRAVSHAPQGKAMTKEQFEDLPIGTLDMAKAVAPILEACGLKLAKPAEGAGDPKA